CGPGNRGAAAPGRSGDTASDALRLSFSKRAGRQFHADDTTKVHCASASAFHAQRTVRRVFWPSECCLLVAGSLQFGCSLVARSLHVPCIPVASSLLTNCGTSSAGIGLLLRDGLCEVAI